MVSVHSINCQPIKPSASYALKPAFRGDDTEERLEDLNEIKKESLNLANNSKSMMGAIGVLGASAAAAAIGAITYKTVAPRGWKFFKECYNKFMGISLVKDSVKYLKKQGSKLYEKTLVWYANIKPDTKLGKMKKINDEKIIPRLKKIKAKTLNFCEKKGWTKEKAKKTGENAAAAGTGLTAAISTANEELEKKNGGHDDN